MFIQHGKYHTACKYCRKKMYQLQLCRKMFINIYPCPSKKVQLFVKLCKTRPSFMVDFTAPGINPILNPFRMDPDAIFDILPKSGENKAPYFFPNLARNAHIKTSGMKLSDVFFIASDSAGSKRRGHGITDGLLYGSKTLVCQHPDHHKHPAYAQTDSSLRSPDNLPELDSRNQRLTK
jgi:hypothetical protein